MSCVKERLSILKSSAINGLDFQGAHKLFEEQANRIARRAAVICGTESLTYGELNGRSNQLACHLRGLGVRAGTLVALCVPRNLNFAVGVLAILKAGGAWVPIDPLQPRNRQELVFKDADVTFLATERSIAAELPEHKAHTILLDEASEAISKFSTSDLQNISSASDLAYVMYTSGSTGRPKGVMITHGNLCHYVRSMQTALAIAETDVYLHTATIAFSSSVRQLMLPLTSGATIVMATMDDIRQPLSLFELIQRQRVTVFDFVPSYWRLCVDALTELDSPTRTKILDNSVRLVLTASEPLRSDLPKKWRSELGQRCQLINMFGQTETTGIVATYRLPPNDELGTGTVCIGGPIPNASIYVLDDNHGRTQIGTVGEIYVSGPTLGPGYLNLPESTSEKFISNPFSNDFGDRLYKTGDLGRYREDGNIDFVGRLDDQVKVRGVRIEPGEVETVLSQHPDLKETAVVARDDAHNNRQLIAYFAPKPGAEVPNNNALRRFLGEKLPEYMIPSAFVVLDALPRLPSGKLDRHALPAPDQSRSRLDSTFVAPRTALEREVAAIWQVVLAIGAISITDNFFDLGGNSLNALILLTRIDRTLGKKLSLASLYRAPTVQELSALLSDEQRQTSMVSLFPLQPYGSKPPFYWLHGEVSDAYLPRYLGPDQPVYTLGHQSEDGKRARYQTVEAIASHCVSEMRAIQPKGPYYIGGFCLGGLIAVEIARQLRSTGENVALLFALEPDAFKNCSRSITAAFRPGASQGPRLGHDYVRYVEDLVRVEKGQRIIYVLRKVQRQAAHWLDRAMFAIKTVICFACVNLGIALPISLRSFYIRSIYDRATSKYELKVFPGSFSVIAQESPSNATFPWQELATNGVDVSTIPAAGHTDILKEPHIKFWAEKLRTMLQEAQSSRGFKANT